jgi:hypothetical protein
MSRAHKPSAEETRQRERAEDAATHDRVCAMIADALSGSGIALRGEPTVLVMRERGEVDIRLTASMPLDRVGRQRG